MKNNKKPLLYLKELTNSNNSFAIELNINKKPTKKAFETLQKIPKAELIKALKELESFYFKIAKADNVDLYIGSNLEELVLIIENEILFRN